MENFFTICPLVRNASPSKKVKIIVSLTALVELRLFIEPGLDY